MGRFQRSDYKWMLTADPPVCLEGRPLAILTNCERLRRQETCWCRFDVSEITDDLTAIGFGSVAEDWLHDDLEPQDVEAFRDDVRRSVERGTRACSDLDEGAAKMNFEHALDRVRLLVSRLDRLVEREVGMSDQYVDDLEE